MGLHHLMLIVLTVPGWYCILPVVHCFSFGFYLYNSVWVIDGIFQSFSLSQLKYPSALTSFEQITNFAKGKRIALFLDYDGTLSPIVDNPDSAFMSENVSNLFLFCVQNSNWELLLILIW